MIILQQYFKELYHFYSIVEICNMNLSTSTTKKNKSNLIFLWQYLYYEQRICLDYGTIRIRVLFRNIENDPIVFVVKVFFDQCE